jgi:hypothetical protein
MSLGTESDDDPGPPLRSPQPTNQQKAQAIVDWADKELKKDHNLSIADHPPIALDLAGEALRKISKEGGSIHPSVIFALDHLVEKLNDKTTTSQLSEHERSVRKFSFELMKKCMGEHLVQVTVPPERTPNRGARGSN